jgi:hypothetical protein
MREDAGDHAYCNHSHNVQDAVLATAAAALGELMQVRVRAHYAGVHRLPTCSRFSATCMPHTMHRGSHVCGGGREQLVGGRHIAKAVQHPAVVWATSAKADGPRLRLLPPLQRGGGVVAQPAGMAAGAAVYAGVAGA